MIKQIIIFIFFILLEPVKRILSLFLYPLVYPFRDKLRAGIMWKTFLYYPTFKPLWFFLDDSIYMEQGKEYDDKEKRYPSFLWNAHNNFMLSWYWSAIRNSFCNWNNYVAFKLGYKQKVLKKWGSINNFMELRQFENGKRLYSEFFIGDKWFQFGFISCGRFEIDLLKTRKKK